MHFIQIASWVICGLAALAGAFLVLMGYGMSDNPNDQTGPCLRDTFILAAIFGAIGKFVSYAILFIILKMFGG